MHQDNGANITSRQSLSGQITFQYDEIQFIDHRAKIRRGTKVTSAGEFLPLHKPYHTYDRGTTVWRRQRAVALSPHRNHRHRHVDLLTT